MSINDTLQSLQRHILQRQSHHTREHAGQSFPRILPTLALATTIGLIEIEQHLECVAALQLNGSTPDRSDNSIPDIFPQRSGLNSSSTQADGRIGSNRDPFESAIWVLAGQRPIH